MTEDFAQSYNQNARISTRYRWHDLNGNSDYDPGEVDLSQSGPDFISVTGATNNILNPNLKQPKTYEVSLGLEREVMNNFGAKVLYVYKRQVGLYKSTGVNVLRPYSAVYRADYASRSRSGRQPRAPPTMAAMWSCTTTRISSRADRSSDRKCSNSPGDRPDFYHTVEVSMNKRMSQKWDLGAHLLEDVQSPLEFGGNAIPDNPNPITSRSTRPRTWYFKGVGTYILPLEHLHERVRAERERRTAAADLRLPRRRSGRRATAAELGDDHAAARSVRRVAAADADLGQLARVEASVVERTGSASSSSSICSTRSTPTPSRRSRSCRVRPTARSARSFRRGSRGSASPIVFRRGTTQVICRSFRVR